MYETIDLSRITVADLVIQHPSAMPVFNKYGIDYCCGGKLPLQQACEKVGINPQYLLQELEKSGAASMPGTIRFDTWDTTLLTDFIVQHHHQYVRVSIPELIALIEKVVNAHGDTHPELAELQHTFSELGNELLQHMEKEELILFPAIQRLFTERPIPVSTTPLPVNLHAPMRVMEDEHTHAGDLIKKLRSITSGYAPPPDACPTYRVTYKRLQEFDQDLMQHIHLENNVLFTKVKDCLSDTLN